MPALAFLAIAPDFDYFALWWFGVELAPRVTHSLAFCALLAGGVSFLFNRAEPALAGRFPFPLLAVASCSHPFLDLLVGVHSVPLFWPFSQTELMLPVGVLPSAGRLQVTNYYLWRNLFIEMGVLLPVLALVVALARSTPVARIAALANYVVPVWAVFLAWALSLSR